MKALLTLDLYVWKYFIPRINPKLFKLNLFSWLAIAYISFFKMPRLFIRHYFRGTGRSLTIDAQRIIVENPLIYDRLIAGIEESRRRKSLHDHVPISQTLVSHPNYKYSVGSFIISYAFEKELIAIQVSSVYQFTPHGDRLTQHLHNRLVASVDNGRAATFKVESDTWTVNYTSLLATQTNAWLRKNGTLGVLYI